MRLRVEVWNLRSDCYVSGIISSRERKREARMKFVIELMRMY